MASAHPIPLPIPDDMDLATLLLRLRVALAGEFRASTLDQTWLIDEILVRCQTVAEEPEEVLAVLAILVQQAPEAGLRFLIAAFQRGVAPSLRAGLIALLEAGGIDLTSLRASCLGLIEVGTPAEKVEALRLLCALGPESEAAIVVLLTADVGRLWPLEQARVESLARLGSRGLPQVREALAHPDSNVRTRAEAVVHHLGEDALDVLPDLLQMPGASEPSPAIFRLGSAAIPQLLHGLRSPSNRIRSRATLVLGALKDQHPHVIPAIFEALDSHFHDHFQEVLQAILWRDASSELIPMPDPVIPCYREALSHNLLTVRVAAATALAVAGQPDEPVPDILFEVLRRGDPHLHGTALWALGACPDLPLDLFDLIGHQPEGAERFADRVARLGPPSPHAVRGLLTAYLHTDEELPNIASALQRSGALAGEELLAALRTGAAPEGRPLRYRRARLLFPHLDGAVLQLAWAGLQEFESEWSDPFVAHLLCSLLARGGAADEVLEIAREHPNPVLRRAATDSLLDGPAEAIPFLLAALEDPDQDVRGLALRTILSRWMEEALDPAWRQRLIEATLRTLARVAPPLQPASPALDLPQCIRQPGAMLTALEQVVEAASAEECRAACHALQFAAALFPSELIGQARKVLSALYAILERFPGLRSEASAAASALFGDEPPGFTR
ncbi:MAG: HEAT repeat domain-containing protein [Gemmataceae bacterium]